MTDLRKLITRLERLDEPCRECDGLIAEYIGEPFGITESINEVSRSYRRYLQQKHYTANTDFAMSIIPDGWRAHAITFDSIMGGKVETELRDVLLDHTDAWGYHALLPISICIASLIAIEGMNDE